MTTTPTIQVRRPDQLLDLPNIITKLMADEPALTKHLAVADRYRQAVAKTVELARELEQARREDDARRRDALAAGRKPKEPRAPQVEDDLAQAKRDVELLAGAVRDSMTTLATAAVAFIDEAAAELERRREASIERLRDLIRAAETAIVEHGALGGEAGWVAGLRISGRVVGYRPGTHAQALRRTADAVRRLALDLDEDLHRQGEIDEALRREKAVELPLPAGARVWSPGSTKVVSEAGELVEDALLSVSERPSPVELLERPGALLTTTDLAALGLPRKAIESVLRSVEPVYLPAIAGRSSGARTTSSSSSGRNIEGTGYGRREAQCVCAGHTGARGRPF